MPASSADPPAQSVSTVEQHEITRRHARVRRVSTLRAVGVTMTAFVTAAIGWWVDRHRGWSEPALVVTAAALGPMVVSAWVGRTERRWLGEVVELQADFDDRAAVTGESGDWYPPSPGVDPVRRRVMIVWANALWDVEQRRLMASWVLGSGVLWTLIGAALAWFTKTDPLKLIPGWIAPSAALYELVMASYISHRRIAHAKADLAARCEMLLDQGDPVDPFVAGQLAAELSGLRAESPRVLPWIQDGQYVLRRAETEGFFQRQSGAATAVTSSQPVTPHDVTQVRRT